MAGLYFEEFSEGQMFEHAMTRTVTETDNVLFTTMTMNPQPLHLDAEFAKSTEFGRPLVNSIFTLGLVIGIGVVVLAIIVLAVILMSSGGPPASGFSR